MDKKITDKICLFNDDEAEYLNEPHISSIGLNVLIKFLKENNHNDKDIVKLIEDICNQIMQNENSLLSCQILTRAIDYFKNNTEMTYSKILDCIVHFTK